MKKKVSNKEIADYLDKSVHTINGWKTKFPKLLEVCKIGVYCKKNNFTIEKINHYEQLEKMLKNQNKE